MKILSFLVLMLILSLLYVRVCAMDDLCELSRKGAPLEEQLRAAARIKNINFGQLIDTVEREDAAAQLKLADLYRYTINDSREPLCEQKKRLHVKWLRSAAERGNPEAQYLYGDLFLFGYGGVLVDTSEASAWMTRAAEQGYMRAQNDIALHYKHGKWARDEFECKRLARKWYTILLNQAQKELIEKEGREDREKALMWYNAAVEGLFDITLQERQPTCSII